MSLAAPVAFPGAVEAAADETCRTVVVPGSGAVSRTCGTPIPQPVKECALGVALGAGAGAATAGAPGAVGGAASGVAGCGAKLLSSQP